MTFSTPTSVSTRLRKLGQSWAFDSEAVLEDFMWSNLSHFFDLSPLKRQFSVDGQICDILALDKDNRLSVLELKNVEDRYVVNQLTRYYGALVEQRPFQDQVDYSKPIRLIAIAPNFHKDNLSDQKYSLLDIELAQFSISQGDTCLSFELKHDGKEPVKMGISFPLKPDGEDIPPPPRALLNLLSECPEAVYQNALKARERILKFDKRIKEVTGSSSVCYGSGKTKLCAEFRFDRTRKTPALFLWLPHVTSTSLSAKKITARMRLWTDWSQVTDIGHVPEGMGRKISFDEWRTASVRPLNKLLPSNSYGSSKEKYFSDSEFRRDFVERYKYLRRDPHYESGLALSINDYMKLIGSETSDSLERLLDSALETWLQRLKR